MTLYNVRNPTQNGFTIDSKSVRPNGETLNVDVSDSTRLKYEALGLVFTAATGGDGGATASAQLPVSLGSKNAAASLSVALASDHAPIDVQTASEFVLSNGSAITEVSSVSRRWVEDFGGNAVDLTLWDEVVVSGTMSRTVANSALTLGMGTTANAEYQLLSKQTFTVPFDVSFVGNLSQRIANNDVYVEIVEVDATTGAVVPNPFNANEPLNRSGVRFSGTSATTIILEAIADGSPNVDTVNNATQVSTTSIFQATIEFRPLDAILTTGPVDSVAARNSTPLCLSRQAIDPNKLYKVRLRFKNGGSAPASNTNVVFNRVLVMDVQELTAEITSGRGDSAPGKGIAVNFAGTQNVNVAGALPAGANVIGTTIPTQNTTAAGVSAHRKISTADTNLTSVKTSAGKLVGGVISNISASPRFFKLYNKASAPVVATDVPVFTMAIPPNEKLELGSLFGQIGFSFGTGIAYALTGAAVDTDATAIGAAEVLVNLTFA